MGRAKPMVNKTAVTKKAKRRFDKGGRIKTKKSKK